MTKRQRWLLARQKAMTDDYFRARLARERKRPFKASPFAWMEKQRAMVRRQGGIEPILYVKKKDSWALRQVLPAVPPHSFGTIGGTIRRYLKPNPATSINERKYMLGRSKPRRKTRERAIQQKKRTFQALRIARRSGLEVPQFADYPMDKKVRHMNPTRGRDKNGFLISTLEG